jgi:hypothetical protein
MVPRTAQRVSNDQTIGKRPVIVGTGRAESEELATTAHQDHVLGTDLSQNHSTIGKVPHRKSIPEIRFWSAIPFCHASSLQLNAT